MKQKAVLIIAIALGAAAFLLTHLYLKAEQEKLYANATKVTVVIAREDMPVGTVLTTSNTATTDFFAAGLGSDVFKAEQRNVVLGKSLEFPVRKGNPLRWHHLGTNLNQLTGLAPTVPSGMRAISIPVSGETAVSGLVRPNDKVDILGTFSFLSETNAAELETVTFTVLQEVTVLATGQETARQELAITSSRRSSSYNMVTIAVFPEEAELLAFAMNVKGSLMLSLRNPNDISTKDDTPPIDFQALQRELPRLNARRKEANRRRRGLER